MPASRLNQVGIPGGDAFLICAICVICGSLSYLPMRMTSNVVDLTIHIPNENCERVNAAAAKHGMTLVELFEAFSTKVLAEFDAETRLRLRAGRGDAAAGLAILDKLDKAVND